MDGLKPASRRRRDALGRLDRAQRDALLARHCRGQGYAVESVGSGAIGAKLGDGVDMVLRRGDEFVLVQCKHWTATMVSDDAVHELLGVMADLDATGGVLVTNGAFSSAAIELAGRHGRLELVDGETLCAMLEPGPHDEPPLSVDADGFEQGTNAGENVEWMFSTGDRAQYGGLVTAPAGPLLLWSLGLKLACAFALVLLFAWAIDTAVHPLLQPLRPHRVSAAMVPATSAPAEGYVLHATQSAPQDTADQATPDAWHQPSEDEILEQQRKANAAMKVIQARTPGM